ncbi:MAG TPA: hypothetical protein VFY88_11685 [Intrasporangium sp.]|nr:hypothetical protein [Intrasporangium sp.]
MGAMTVLPRSRPLARADLVSMPDDGHRYDALTLTAWHLENGRFIEVAHVSGDETFETRRPFPISIRPADLDAP